MVKLEDVKKGSLLRGIESDEIVRVVTVEPVGDHAITVYYKTNQGRLGEQMLFRSDEARLELAEAGRPWGFDAPGEEFKLALEAYRINLAHLFDPMMAIHTSNVEPLPHQISAVYEAMLPRQPLRFILADDPGAGKTIMAGLLIRELLIQLFLSLFDGDRFYGKFRDGAYKVDVSDIMRRMTKPCNGRLKKTVMF